ncbi:MAG TPA: ATP-binding protein [Kofleriaceae bacterium]
MTIAPPTPDAQLTALRELTTELPLATSEAGLMERALQVAGTLFPGRALCVRVVDVRTREPARSYVRGASLRESIGAENVTISDGALAKAKLKGAVAASARLNVRDRWDSPFTGMATGFALPLAAAGELYGVLDLGYPPSLDARLSDEPLAWPVAAQIAIALRTLRLADDALGLRDYQSRLLESANALILGVDRNWRITVANHAILDLTGFSRDELVGRDVRDFLSPDQRQFLTTAFAAALAGQHHEGVTVVLPTKSGGAVRTVWSIAPVGRAGAGSAIEAVVAIGQDQSRIDALQQQVVRAERLATLGELAAGIVHELNNPLTSITVYSDYLVKKLEGQNAEATDVDKVRRIGASAHRILRFSRDLVQYARPSGTELEPVDVASVVRQSVSICEHLIERGGIELTVEVDPELPVVQAVAGQLEQVLINLITNAVHAIEGGSTSSVRDGKVIVRAGVDGPASVVIEVADSGPGIPEPAREKIFEPFFTTKPDGKGTGLGLPIVRNIVEHHKGEISVDASDLGGAAFRVILPIA